jgi:hypothetical protein
MKKSHGYIISIAIWLVGIGSMIVNVSQLALGNFGTYMHFTIGNITSVETQDFINDHYDMAVTAGNLVFSLLLITLLLTGVILIFQKQLSVVALRFIAIAAAIIFSTRPAIWGTIQSLSLTQNYGESTKSQQDAYLHFLVGTANSDWRFTLSYYGAGLLMTILLGLQIMWTFQIKEDPEVAAEKARAKEAEEAAAAQRRAAYAEAEKKREAERVSSRPPVTPQVPATKNLSTELASLTELHKSGALTDEEFATAKKRILGS